MSLLQDSKCLGSVICPNCGIALPTKSVEETVKDHTITKYVQGFWAHVNLRGLGPTPKYWGGRSCIAQAHWRLSAIQKWKRATVRGGKGVRFVSLGHLFQIDKMFCVKIGSVGMNEELMAQQDRIVQEQR